MSIRSVVTPNKWWVFVFGLAAGVTAVRTVKERQRQQRVRETLRRRAAAEQTSGQDTTSESIGTEPAAGAAPQDETQTDPTGGNLNDNTPVDGGQNGSADASKASSGGHH